MITVSNLQTYSSDNCLAIANNNRRLETIAASLLNSMCRLLVGRAFFVPVILASICVMLSNCVVIEANESNCNNCNKDNTWIIDNIEIAAELLLLTIGDIYYSNIVYCTSSTLT